MSQVRIVKTLIRLLIISSYSIAVYGQLDNKKLLKGVVITKDGEPLAHAMIQLPGSFTECAFTDLNGKFSFYPKGSKSLVVNYNCTYNDIHIELPTKSSFIEIIYDDKATIRKSKRIVKRINTL